MCGNILKNFELYREICNYYITGFFFQKLAEFFLHSMAASLKPQAQRGLKLVAWGLKLLAPACPGFNLINGVKKQINGGVQPDQRGQKAN